ncbi:MAG: hypothetical protein JO226_04155 [Pluralibacter sp.]|nr:hypothetical protein [Pluralibacter sp.]
MGITSADLNSRNAGNGGQMHARTARQIQRKKTVHYLVSPPRQPPETSDKPKLKVHCLTRLEVASR